MRRVWRVCARLLGKVDYPRLAPLEVYAPAALCCIHYIFVCYAGSSYLTLTFTKQALIPALRDSGLQCGSWDAPQASGRRLAHYERCDRGRQLAGERGRTACALQGGAQRGGAQAAPRLVVGEARAERGRRREDRRGGKAHAH